MANDVYSPTTVSSPKTSCWLGPSSEHLGTLRFYLKVAEVLLSLVAFILEETVTSCTSCSPLYFFEFVSCTAFLFTTLLLILLATRLHSKVGINRWPILDFVYTAVIALLFLISSIAFASNNGGTSVETISVVFGFLAMLAFVVDFVFFLKTKGLPFTKNQAPPNDNGSAPQPEAEKLNGEANVEANGAQ